MQSSPTARLATHVLGEDLEEWVGRYRHIGLSWTKTARLLHEHTDGEVQISAEHLRRLCGQNDNTSAAA